MNSVRPAFLLSAGMACAFLCFGGRTASAQSNSLFGGSGPAGSGSSGFTGGSPAGGLGSSAFSSGGLGSTGMGSSGLGGTGGTGLGSGGLLGSGSGMGSGLGSTGLGTGMGQTGAAGGQQRFVGQQNQARFVGQTQAGQQQAGLTNAGRGAQGRGGRNARGGNQNQNPFTAQGGAGGQQQRTIRPSLKVAIDYPAPTAVTTSKSLKGRYKNVLASRAGMSGVTVETSGSTVILRGMVDSEDTRRLAATIARLEPGVRTVQNDLTVSAPVPAPEE